MAEGACANKANLPSDQRRRVCEGLRLAAQIQSAAVSIMSNIAEGFDRKSRSEFHQFLVIAKGSCAEVRSQLYVAFDVGYIDQDTFQELYEMAEETSRVLEGLRAQVEAQRDSGRNARPSLPSGL
jgi:four helix bundle protein